MLSNLVATMDHEDLHGLGLDALLQLSGVWLDVLQHAHLEENDLEGDSVDALVAPEIKMMSYKESERQETGLRFSKISFHKFL